MGKDSNWGYLPYLTDDQKKMLADLRKRVDAELPKKEWLAKDTTLLRYCRARNFNPAKTWSMLKEDVEWREPFEGYMYCRNRDFGGAYAMHEEGAIRLAGKAKDGRPVVMVQARYYWPKLIEDNLQIVYFFTFYVDAVCKMAEAVGQETFYAISDLEGFSMSNFSFPQIKIAISILQNHYPERLGTIFVINAPFLFTAAWRMIQPLLDERTRNKIEILGSNYLQVVTQHIDLDQIEKPWGGTHEKYPVPDPIVQIAIDNEERLLRQQQAAIEAPRTAVAAAVAEDTTPMTVAKPPSVMDLTRTASETTESSSATRKSMGVRKTVRKLMKKMLFITDTRTLASSMGADPDSAETALPKRLTGTSSPRSPPRRLKSTESVVVKRNEYEDEGEVDPSADFDRDILEVKEAHDKLLTKVETLEKLVLAEKKTALKMKQSFQKQLMVLAVLVLVLMGFLIKERMRKDMDAPGKVEL